MGKERYRRGAHTVTDFKYHFVWKSKYSYDVLRGDTALRLRDIIREICVANQMEVIKGNIRPNHIHILVSAPAYLFAGKNNAVSQRQKLLSTAAGISPPAEKVLGAASMVSRVFSGQPLGLSARPR